MKMNKQGSALLIVLGFLSFMVVSAVAFAIYMRTERMPSSALRRSIATRHLVKAALAEAISRVDDAVSDDPFPGLVGAAEDGRADNEFYRDANNQVIDMWTGRVFTPPDPQGGTTDRNSRYAPISETVSVLTLEALGYLPPPLVNDVRFLSRSTWTASWNQLPFDSGRFAYCAVNVSDYLDVNRITANKPRTAEPQRRLSVSHLFDQKFNSFDNFVGQYPGISDFAGNNRMSDPQTDQAQAFDKFVGKDGNNAFRGYVQGNSADGLSAIGDAAPYVSMLDYNLALSDSGLSGNALVNPLFQKLLTSRQSGNGSYYEAPNNPNQSNPNTPVDVAARQPFVTDSWSTNETWAIDISKKDDQPFTQKNWLRNRDWSKTIFRDLALKSGKFLNEMYSRGILGIADAATLYDYLDYDNMPCSLAFPCVETVPMISGVTPPTFQMTKFDSDGDDDNMTWKFNASSWFNPGQGQMRIVVPFPFKNVADRGYKVNDYAAQVLMRIVLATSGADRTQLVKKLAPTEANNIWLKQPSVSREDKLFSFTLLSAKKSFRVPGDVIEDSEAHIDDNGGYVKFTFGDFGAFNDPGGNSIPVLTKATATDPQTKKKTTTYTIEVSPLDANGDPAVQPGTSVPEDAFGALANVTYVPHVLMWVRILDTSVSDDKENTVDLVPASPYDDTMLGGQQSDPAGINYVYGLTGREYEDARPAFHFFADAQTGFSLQTIQSGFNGSVIGDGGNYWRMVRGGQIEEVKGLFAVDPRFNYSPEHWYCLRSSDGGEIDFPNWLNKTRAALAQFSDRDPDIFMFTSNQGVLQSFGELGFLPCLRAESLARAVNNNRSFDSADGFSFIDENGGGVVGESADKVMSRFAYLWRTYDQRYIFKRLERIPGARIGRSRQNEALVNPHTDNPGVMMAALANTPGDYWVAARGVNVTGQGANDVFQQLGNHNDSDDGKKELKTAKDAEQYRIGDRGRALIRDKELMTIAKTVMCAMGGSILQARDKDLEDIMEELKKQAQDSEANGSDAAFRNIDAKCDSDADVRKRHASANTFRRSIANRFKTWIRTGYTESWGVNDQQGDLNKKIKYSPSSVWQGAWDQLWDNLAFNPNLLDPQSPDSFKDFLGVSLNEPLHTVDRKFLYSYWRDCFANNQQLFLIFVRAESSALGGPGEGTPGQLGGRAVALVWRDPDWTEANGQDRDRETTINGRRGLQEDKKRPHRTRVLFYHQFD